MKRDVPHPLLIARRAFLRWAGLGLVGLLWNEAERQPPIWGLSPEMLLRPGQQNHQFPHTSA